MEKLLKKLPLEIVKEKIIPYTYEPQPKELLDDIVSFNKIYFLLDEFYNDVYFSDENSQYIHGKFVNEYARDELYDDIYNYLERNNKIDVWMRLLYYSENGRYTQKFYNIFETQERYYRYIFDYHVSEYNVKILLALLTTTERMELLIYLYEYWKLSDFWENERSRFFTWMENRREEYKKIIFKPIELYINDI